MAENQRLYPIPGTRLPEDLPFHLCITIAFLILLQCPLHLQVSPPLLPNNHIISHSVRISLVLLLLIILTCPDQAVICHFVTDVDTVYGSCSCHLAVNDIVAGLIWNAVSTTC